MLLKSVDMDISKVKLVIWDLDNTFWKGTVTEGGCEANPNNISLIKELTQRGIVNSICSKNNYEECKNILIQLGVWEYFVFPSIDWNPKGRRVHQIIKDMNLRAANVLFLDDEPSNLQAALLVDSSLMCGSIEELGDEMLRQTLGLKVHKSASRLQQYQDLQRKVKTREIFDSDEDFLKLSEIKITIAYDCMAKFDRILELINRTNQLNFTKIRLNEGELKQLLNDSLYECGYISCSDKFSDYGIVGFYALNRKAHSLLHFLFSCRTIGMGGEQYVYAYLKFPMLQVSGNVVTRLDDHSCPDWIQFTENKVSKKNNSTRNKPTIVVKGPCDVSQVIPFFSNGAGFYEELAYVSNSKIGTYIESHNHTSQILQSITGDDATKSELISTLLFVDDEYFSTKLFNEKYDYFIFSVLTDYGLGLYRNKHNEKLIVPFGQYTVDYTNEENWDSIKGLFGTDNLDTRKEEYHYFCENYEPIGRITDEDFLHNLTEIRERLPETTKMIFLNGAEVPYLGECKDKWIGREEIHKQMNGVLDQFVQVYPDSCTIIDVNDYLTDDMPYLDTINHYKKNVYYHIALGIKDYISGMDHTVDLQTTACDITWVGKMKKFLGRMKGKIVRVKNKLFSH